MKIIFIAPYPWNEAPSQRFRFEQYIPYIKNKDGEVDFYSFWDIETWKILYKPGNTLRKIFGFIKGVVERIILMFFISKYDYVFIHREAAPVGPPVFEWIIAKVFGKKIIYDFDDAIWLPNVSDTNQFVSGLKWHSKVKSICRYAYKVTVGNHYLETFAKLYNDNTVYIPTTIDTQYHSGKRLNTVNTKPIIGWTGSISTNYYLKILEPVFIELRKKFDFELIIISNVAPDLYVPYTFIKWSIDTEIEDLNKIDIGIMPLPDNLWTQGKCGFKLIQYLSLGKTAVASPVGANLYILQNNISGIFATTNEEWISALSELLEDEGKRNKYGEAGKNYIENNFSVKANTYKYLELFNIEN